MASNSRSLTRFARLSIMTALVTILLKVIAYLLTGSVGLLSDAMESLVNLAAAGMAFWMLKLSEKPPDEKHMYGHSKAEYFSSVFEGTLILFAAVGISWTALQRIFVPRPIEQPALGLFISMLAALINLLVARKLITAGQKYHSLTLEADGRHLLTDVWTSVGVFIAIVGVMITGVQLLDPLVALFIAFNIVVSGFRIIGQSVMGFMDTAISEKEKRELYLVLEEFATKGVQFHGIRTRQSGVRRFVSMHVLVPGEWPIRKGHDLLERIEAKIREKISNITVFTHLEPLEDEKSWADITLDRS